MTEKTMTRPAYGGPVTGLFIFSAVVSTILISSGRTTQINAASVSDFLIIITISCLIALCCAVALKLAARPLMGMSLAGGMITAFMLLMLTTHAVCAGLAYLANNQFPSQQNIAYWQSPFVVQITIIAATVYIIVLRILYMRGQIQNAMQASQTANLQALQSRIRPHFMFNSMNSIAGLIRNNPQLAELALQDLADLVRVLMADARKLVPLTAEIETSRQYLKIEKMRLGDRLAVKWHIDKIPKTCQVPSLVLQPLLENAVYHGIEPSFGGGMIDIDMRLSMNKVHILIRNPLPDAGGDHHSKGNKIAMENIRERLRRHFGDDASVQIHQSGEIYSTRIVIPLVTKSSEHESSSR